MQSDLVSYAESMVDRKAMLTNLRQTAEKTLSRTSISFKLQASDAAPSKVFTTGSTITGEVIINASVPVAFSDVTISFEGTVRTWMEKYGTITAGTGHYVSAQTFLRLVQPLDADALPDRKVITPEEPLTLPFTFTIPSTLLPPSCPHSLQPHLLLPPSTNNQLAGYDDGSPNMTSINYSIAALIRSAQGTPLARAFRPVTVIPTLPELPPQLDPEFPTSVTRTIRRRLIRKIGTLTLTTTEPKPIVLSNNDPRNANPTSLKLTLAFTPAGASPPPRLTTAKIVLKTHTFYSTLRMKTPPSIAAARNDPSMAYYTKTRTLSTHSLAGVAWEEGKEEVALTLPIVLGGSKEGYPGRGGYLLPSFTSCFVARKYELVVRVGVEGGGKGIKGRTGVQVVTVNSEKGGITEENGSWEELVGEDVLPGYERTVGGRR